MSDYSHVSKAAADRFRLLVEGSTEKLVTTEAEIVMVASMGFTISYDFLEQTQEATRNVVGECDGERILFVPCCAECASTMAIMIANTHAPAFFVNTKNMLGDNPINVGGIYCAFPATVTIEQICQVLHLPEVRAWRYKSEEHGVTLVAMNGSVLDEFNDAQKEDYIAAAKKPVDDYLSP